MRRSGFDASNHVRPDTMSVHLYGRRMRKRLAEAENGRPHQDSLLGRLLQAHGIYPDFAPIPTTPTSEPEKAKRRESGAPTRR
jgi:hypothetical protein